jgi:hypothetical protein
MTIMAKINERLFSVLSVEVYKTDIHRDTYSISGYALGSCRHLAVSIRFLDDVTREAIHWPEVLTVSFLGDLVPHGLPSGGDYWLVKEWAIPHASEPIIRLDDVYLVTPA